MGSLKCEGKLNMDMMKTAEYVSDYLNKIQKDNDTMKAYSLDLEKFVNIFGERNISDLKKEDLDEYLNALLTRSGKKVSVATQNRHYATLSCFFNYLLRAGSISDNPMKKIERRRPLKDQGEANNKEIIRYLDKETVNVILSRSRSLREEFLFDLLYSSGLRISEALSLNVQDIRNGVIHVRQGKGNKARITYLSKSSEKLFKKFMEKRVPERAVVSKARTIEEAKKLQSEGALFTTNNGTRLGYHRANQLFKQASEDLKNPDGTVLTIHQLRHTFCTERVGYIDIRVLQKLAGHSDIRTTLRYAKVADKVAKNQFAKFDEDRDKILVETGIEEDSISSY